MNIACEALSRPIATASDVERWRSDFPLLRERVRGRPLVYLDNAATTHKPRAVIDAGNDFYAYYNANVHRGVHTLSQRATDAFEAARVKVQRFINAAAPAEVVFTRGTTDAINLVAQSFVRPMLAHGDEILISAMEHHSNIVPWQLVCEQTGAILKVVPINDAGEFQFQAYELLLGARTRFVAISQVSNALGSITDIERVVALAHARGVPVLVDGAQAISHVSVDVCTSDCDFFVFSGHKSFGPTGIGVLYGKAAQLRAMPPYQGGGDMIRSVTFEKTEYADIPQRFEAGTPNIAGAIALGVALDYVAAIGVDAIVTHERDLLRYATRQLSCIPGLRIIGNAKEKAGIVSFILDGVHPHDIGTVLDGEGVAIRTGHHCAMPAMQHFGLPGGTARASFAMYNTQQDVEALAAAIHKVRRTFG